MRAVELILRGGVGTALPGFVRLDRWNMLGHALSPVTTGQLDRTRFFFKIAAQPHPQTCWWQQPYPNVGNADVNDLAVACTASGTFVLTGTQSSNSGHSATLLPNGMV